MMPGFLHNVSYNLVLIIIIIHLPYIKSNSKLGRWDLERYPTFAPFCTSMFLPLSDIATGDVATNIDDPKTSLKSIDSCGEDQRYRHTFPFADGYCTIGERKHSKSNYHRHSLALVKYTLRNRCYSLFLILSSLRIH